MIKVFVSTAHAVIISHVEINGAVITDNYSRKTRVKGEHISLSGYLQTLVCHQYGLNLNV